MTCTILRLDPPIPLDTPKGSGLAHLVIDYGVEHHLVWCIFMDETREVWCFENPLVRADKNITMGRIGNATPFAQSSDVSAFGSGR